MRGLLVKLMLAAISTVVSVLLMEYLVRWILPVYDPPGMISFAYENGVPLAPKNFVGRQWKNTEDYDVSVRINSYGFRDNKDLSESTGEDLFVVGDSFSFGHGVEECERYSNLLETLLGKRVYNISIPTNIDGYDRLLAYAEEQGATVQNLLIGICMENDIRDYEAGEMPRSGCFWGAKVYLTGHSAAYNALTAIIHQNAHLERVASRMKLVAEDPIRSGTRFPSKVAIESSVKRLKTLQEHHQIGKVTIVIIPSRGLWLGDERQMHAKVHEEFVGGLLANGFKVIDLRGTFEKEGAPLQYHFKNDPHWNAQGHLQAAEAIFRYLKDNSCPISDYSRPSGVFDEAMTEGVEKEQ